MITIKHVKFFTCFISALRPKSLLTRLPGHQAPDHLDRIEVAINDALFERNNGVVGDMNVFWANFCTAFGDIAETNIGFFA